MRSDIRSSFGASTTTAKGVRVTVRLTLRDSANGYKVIKGAAVYLWHCDIDGQYSMYSQNVSERELPARRAGLRRRRAGHVHHDLPGCL